MGEKHRKCDLCSTFGWYVRFPFFPLASKMRGVSSLSTSSLSTSSPTRSSKPIGRVCRCKGVKPPPDGIVFVFGLSPIGSRGIFAIGSRGIFSGRPRKGGRRGGSRRGGSDAGGLIIKWPRWERRCAGWAISEARVGRYGKCGLEAFEEELPQLPQRGRCGVGIWRGWAWSRGRNQPDGRSACLGSGVGSGVGCSGCGGGGWRGSAGNAIWIRSGVGSRTVESERRSTPLHIESHAHTHTHTSWSAKQRGQGPQAKKHGSRGVCFPPYCNNFPRRSTFFFS